MPYLGPLQNILLCVVMTGALTGASTLLPACDKDKKEARREAPQEGVVGRVVALQGRVTWSASPTGPRTALKQGDEVRAEWIVHTAPGARLSVRLENGHRWTLAGDLSKRVRKVRALTLPPVRQGALGRVADLGGRGGMDRSAAAGLHHEMSAGRSAVATRADQVEAPDTTVEKESDNKTKKAEAPPPVGKKGFADEKLDEARQTRRRRTPSRRRIGRAPRTPRRRPKSAPLELPRGGLGGKGGGAGRVKESRGGGGGGGGGGDGARVRPATETATPRARPRPTPRKPRRPAATSAPRKPSASPARRLAPRKARLTACLKRHERTGAQVVFVIVAAKTGKIRAVFASGTQPTSPLGRCLRAALAGVTLPARASSYRVRVPLYVK